LVQCSIDACLAKPGPFVDGDSSDTKDQELPRTLMLICRWTPTDSALFLRRGVQVTPAGLLDAILLAGGVNDGQ
jgi:hypothetical protein